MPDTPTRERMGQLETRIRELEAEVREFRRLVVEHMALVQSLMNRGNDIG